MTAEERRNLRKQLFIRIYTQNSETQQCTSEWLVEQWPNYIKQNFERSKHEPDKAITELKRMIETRATPAYKFTKGQTNEFIATPRPLSKAELDTLNNLPPPL